MAEPVELATTQIFAVNQDFGLLTMNGDCATVGGGVILVESVRAAEDSGQGFFEVLHTV